jgi:hypothetical protein
MWNLAVHFRRWRMTEHGFGGKESEGLARWLALLMIIVVATVLSQ